MAIRVFAVLGCLLWGGATAWGGEDWKTLFEQLTSSDEKVSAAARERTFKAVLPRLAAADAASVDAEVSQILPVFNEHSEAMRLQASGVITTIGAARSDGLIALRSAVPVLLTQFRDPQPRVRRNAVWAIATMRPHPPLESLDQLKGLLVDADAAYVGTAALGLMRLAPNAAEAEGFVKEALRSEKRPDRLQPLIYGISEARRADGDTVRLLGQFLTHGDDTVALTAALALQRLGRAAVAAAPALRDAMAAEISEGRRRAFATALEAVSH